ncbi:MAG: serine hydrolase domain-containing protein, partial [Streptosporangiaceae bacterium]
MSPTRPARLARPARRSKPTLAPRPTRTSPRPRAIRLPPPEPAGLAHAHLAPLVSDGAVPSLAWAVVRDGDKAVGGFGGAGPETSFQIGSVTKVFTALVLADMAERGEVHLSDPAARYLPGRVTVGPTLADLATHTSGLPRLPRGLLPSALLHPGDPYARYPAGGLVRDARRALRAAPPAGSAQRPYVYSNFGFGLLGYLLGQAAGTPYETLVTTRICAPLGLPGTAFTPPAPPWTAQGHRRGRPVRDWRLSAMAGAGGLYSTAADLARFLYACLLAVLAAPGTPAAPDTALEALGPAI